MNENNNKQNLSDKQKDILESDYLKNHRALFLAGAVISGKTYIANLYFKKLLLEDIREDANVLVIGLNKESVFLNIINPLMKMIGVDSFDVDGKNSVITYKPKNIIIRCMDNNTKIAFPFDFAYIDNFSYLSEDVYDTIITHLRGIEKDGKVYPKPMLATMNMERKDHWVKARIFDRKDKLNYKIIEFTTEDNPVLNISCLYSLKIDLSKSEYKRLVLNQWVDSSSLE